MSDTTAARWVAITKDQHRQAGWRAREGFAFAQGEQLVPVLVPELGHLSMYTLAFVRSGDRLTLVALLGVGDGRNLYLNAQQQWLGSYVPALFRAHPFAFLKADNGQSVLCIRDSHLLNEPPGTDDDKGRIPLFDESGELADVTRKMVEFLQQCEQGRQLTDKACALLDELGLLEHWPLTIDRQAGRGSSAQTGQGEQAVEPIKLDGLWRVNEAQLNQLDGEQLQSLHKAGALKLAYGQLFSMHQLHQLSERAAFHDRQAVPAQPALDSLFGEAEAGLNFDAFGDPDS